MGIPTIVETTFATQLGIKRGILLPALFHGFLSRHHVLPIASTSSMGRGRVKIPTPRSRFECSWIGAAHEAVRRWCRPVAGASST
jgi:hypothetical protein